MSYLKKSQRKMVWFKEEKKFQKQKEKKRKKKF